MLLQSLKELIRYASEYESEFVEKVIVYEREPKKRRGVRLKIVYNCIGEIKIAKPCAIPNGIAMVRASRSTKKSNVSRGKNDQK